MNPAFTGAFPHDRRRLPLNRGKGRAHPIRRDGFILSRFYAAPEARLCPAPASPFAAQQKFSGIFLYWTCSYTNISTSLSICISLYILAFLFFFIWQLALEPALLTRVRSQSPSIPVFDSLSLFFVATRRLVVFISNARYHLCTRDTLLLRRVHCFFFLIRRDTAVISEKSGPWDRAGVLRVVGGRIHTVKRVTSQGQECSWAGREDLATALLYLGGAVTSEIGFRFSLRVFVV